MSYLRYSVLQIKQLPRAIPVLILKLNLSASFLSNNGKRIKIQPKPTTEAVSRETLKQAGRSGVLLKFIEASRNFPESFRRGVSMCVFATMGGNRICNVYVNVRVHLFLFISLLQRRNSINCRRRTNLYCIHIPSVMHVKYTQNTEIVL